MRSTAHQQGVFGQLRPSGDRHLLRCIAGCTQIDVAVLMELCSRAEGIKGLCLPEGIELSDGVLRLIYPRLHGTPIPPSEHTLAEHLPDLVRIVRELHLRGVVHGHLKASNVMLTDAGLVVTDYGLSGVEYAAGWVQEGRARTSCAPYCMPPEALGTTQEAVDATQGEGADIWGIGIVAAEVLCGAGNLPHQRYPPAVAASLLKGHDPLQVGVLLGDCTPEMRGFVAGCLARDPLQRVPLGELRTPPVPPVAVLPTHPTPTTLLGAVLPALDSTGAPPHIIADIKQAIEAVQGQWPGFLPTLLCDLARRGDTHIPEALDTPYSVEGLRCYFIGKFGHKCEVLGLS